MTARRETTPRAAAPVVTEAWLYGIVRWPEPRLESLGAGVGEPATPVAAVPHRSVAALVSRVRPHAVGSAQGVRGLRRDLRAHADVLNRVVAVGATVLPATFGLMFPREESLESQFLKPQYRTLVAQLDRLDDAVEVTLKASYVEDRILEEVVASTPRLATWRATTLDAKIDLGKQIAEALRAKRYRESRLILDELSAAAREVKLRDGGVAETIVLDASLLVPRKSLPKFDQALTQVSRSARGRMEFDCVGPLPPYSFVDLRL